MIEKKSSKGNLEKKRTTFLIIGFVVILGLVYLGFEFFATAKKPIDLGDLNPVFVEITEDVLATDKTQPPPTPVQQQQDILLDIVKNEIEVNLEGIDFSTEYYENAEIPEIEPVAPIGEKHDDPPVYEFPNKMPEPAGGFAAMYAFLKSNLAYPEIPRINGIGGQVWVEFVVEKDGGISNVKVLAGVHPELDKEAVRVVKMLPKWTPGEQLGKPVRCLYRIPIKFTIN